MKLVWSPEMASKAYIDTIKFCELYQTSGVPDLIAATAAGWNAKLIVETWSQTGPVTTSIALAIAARHTGARHVCIVPDERSRSDYARLMGAAGMSPDILAGEAAEVVAELAGVDFLVVDSGRGDFARVLRVARLSQRGAVLVCKNANLKTAASFRWRSVIAGGYRVVRTAFLPVGDGLDIAHVGASGGGVVAAAVKGGKRRWIKHFDELSGEEHVIRT